MEFCISLDYGRGQPNDFVLYISKGKGEKLTFDIVNFIKGRKWTLGKGKQKFDPYKKAAEKKPSFRLWINSYHSFMADDGWRMKSYNMAIEGYEISSLKDIEIKLKTPKRTFANKAWKAAMEAEIENEEEY